MARRRRIAWIALLVALLVAALTSFLLWAPQGDSDPAAAPPALSEPPDRVRVSRTAERPVPAPAAEPEQVPAGRERIVAVVTHHDGRPAVGASLEARLWRRQSDFDAEPWPWSAVAGADGVGTVELERGGLHELRARLGDASCLPTRVDVPFGGEARRRLRIGAATTLTGLVLRGDSSRVPGALVKLVFHDDRASSWEVGTVTDVNGAFRVSGVPLADFERVVSTVMPLKRSPTTFEHRRSELPAPPHLELTIADVVLQGRVVDESGRPVNHSVVYGRRRRRLSWRTGKDGLIRLPTPVRPAEGFYLITKGHAPRMVAVPPEDEDGVIDLGDIVVERGTPLAGVVVGTDDRPIRGATVSLAPLDGFESLRFEKTDDAGRFLLPRVGRGTWRLLVAHRPLGWPTVTLIVDGVSADDPDVRVVLPPLTLLRLSREDASSSTEDPSALSVRLFDPGTDVLRGVLRIPLEDVVTVRMLAGTWDVVLASAGRGTWSGRGVVVPEGRETTLSFTLEPAVR